MPTVVDSFQQRTCVSTLVDTSGMLDDDVKMKFETLRTMDQMSDSMDAMENHLSEHVRFREFLV